MLTWPLEKGKIFGSAIVLDMDRKIQIDGHEYSTIVIRYYDQGSTDQDYTEYFFAEGYGLIRCVYMRTNISDTPIVVDSTEF